MRAFLRLLSASLILAAFITPTRPAAAANLDNTADHVLGQPDFTTDVAHVTPTGLSGPGGVAVQAHTGRLFVVDFSANRVLSWPNALAITNGQAADLVIGQPTFFTSTANNGGLNAAGLKRPNGVAVDAQGNLYVADSGNNRVLVYDAPLTTHAAAAIVIGQPDFSTGDPNHDTLGDTSLSNPTGVAVDSLGNLFVADTGNNRILKFRAPLQTHMQAIGLFGQSSFGTGLPNGPGLGALSLSGPAGLAVDAQDRLYVADDANNRVLQYDFPITGTAAADHVIGQPSFITNTANNGGPSASGLRGPAGVALDAQNDLYVVDSQNNRVLEYTGPITTHQAAASVFGQKFFTNTVSTGLNAAGLALPSAAAVDSRGDLFITDFVFYRVLEYDTPVPYALPTLSALSPSLVAAGGSAFQLSVSGAGFVSGSIVRWQGSNRPTTFVSSTRLQATIPAADVVAGGPFAVTVFTPSPGGGTSLLVNLSLYARAAQDAVADTVFGQPNFQTNIANNPTVAGRAAQLGTLTSLALDPRTGRLFVADAGNHRVLSWPNAQALANAQPADLVIGQPDFFHTTSNTGNINARNLVDPQAVAVDGQGNLYVADATDNRVLVYRAPLSSGMAASVVFGQGGSFSGGQANNGGISPNSLSGPFGLALDGAGNLYVTDGSNERVVEYNRPLSLDTTADHVIGQPNLFTVTVPSGPTPANLSGPHGIALDTSGDLYVTDFYGNRVLEYDQPLNQDAMADRVFGQTSFFSDTTNAGGLGPSSLDGPTGVAVDSAGNVFVSDTGNNRVLEYDTPLTTDRAADRVIGQPGFFTGGSNQNGLSASSLAVVDALALDSHGDLFVTDLINRRVLEYDRPLPLLRIFAPLLKR